MNFQRNYFGKNHMSSNLSSVKRSSSVGTDVNSRNILTSKTERRTGSLEFGSEQVVKPKPSINSLSFFKKKKKER